jgi:hypothetical protein
MQHKGSEKYEEIYMFIGFGEYEYLPIYLYGCIPKRSPVRPRRLFHCSSSHRTLFFTTVSDHETLFIPVSNSTDRDHCS